MTNQTYVPTQDELVIDTGDFDIFSQLDDLDLGDTPLEGQEGNDGPQGDSGTDAEDFELGESEELEDGLEGDSDELFDFDDIDDDDLPEELRKEKEETEEADEEEVEEESEEEDDTEDEEVEGDEEEVEELEEEVDFESHEIELPDGSVVVLKDVIEGYRNAEALAATQAQFEEAKSAFQAEAGNTIKYLKLAKLESQRVIDDYADFDWAELSKKDPQAYVDNREFFEKYKQRNAEIQAAFDEIQAQEEVSKQEQFKADAKACVEDLKATIPGWNNNLYQDLMDYAVENGSSEEYIQQCVDPSVFKMLHKARQFDLGKQTVKAKIKRKVASPKKVVKAQSKTTTKRISNKAKIEAKLDAGITSDSDIFAALED